MNIRFRLQRVATPVLHQAIGPNYLQLLVRPGIGSLTREVMSQHNAEQVYSTARQEIQDKIRSLSQDRLSEKMMEREGDAPYRVSLSDTVILYDTLVYGIELPALVVNAINRKIEQYYISEEYKFRVEREKRESERKKIEAEGVREFQQVVSQGISDSYLRWRGIEATLQLSQSTNSKVVIIGSAKDGLPLILGNMDTLPAQATAGSAPEGGRPESEDTTTTAGPASPSDGTPAAGLTNSPGRNQTAGATPAANAEEPRALWHLSLYDIQAFLSRTVGPTESAMESLPKPPTEKPSASQSR
jgi:hypothetical protein